MIRLQLGVVLDDGKERAEGSGEGVLGLGLFGWPLRAGGDRIGAGVRDIGEDLLLELHVALDRVHEVRDEVVATLELDLDLGEGFVDPEPPLNEAVVDPDHEDDDQDDDDDEDDQSEIVHCPPPLAGPGRPDPRL